jgi:hypothetical protein
MTKNILEYCVFSKYSEDTLEAKKQYCSILIYDDEKNIITREIIEVQ